MLCIIKYGLNVDMLRIVDCVIRVFVTLGTWFV